MVDLRTMEGFFLKIIKNMNEEFKFYTKLFLTVLLSIVCFFGGIIFHKIHGNKVLPTIFVTSNESFQKNMLKIKCENGNINEIIINLAELQKTNVLYFTNYIFSTNFVVINSNITDNVSNFGKISEGLTIKPIETVISTDIDVNTLTNKGSDLDLDEISNQLKNLIEKIQVQKQ